MTIGGFLLYFNNKSAFPDSLNCSWLAKSSLINEQEQSRLVQRVWFLRTGERAGKFHFSFIYFYIYFFFLRLGFHLKEDGKFQDIWKPQMSVTRCSASASPRTSALGRDLNFPWISSSSQSLFPLLSAGAPAASPLGKEKFEGISSLPRIFSGVGDGIAVPGISREIPEFPSLWERKEAEPSHLCFSLFNFSLFVSISI